MPMFSTVGRVEGGELRIIRPERMVREIQKWRDCAVTITVEKTHATRSLRANRYYWGVVIEAISDHTGFTPDETHHVLKQMFLPKALAVTKGNGEIIGEFVIGGTTATLTTVDFYEYCARIKAWALEKLELYIPEPDETDTSNDETVTCDTIDGASGR